MNFLDFANFQPRQLTAFDTLLGDECKYLMYGGAAAGGKSYFLRWSAIALSIFFYQKYKIPKVPIGLFSEDYPTLKDRQISRIKREIPPRIGVLRETRDEGYVFELAEDLGSGLILLRNLDDPSKYMSTEFAAVFVEELTRNSKETFDDLRFRLRYPGIPTPKFVGATNPGGIGHGWVKQLWIDRTAEDPELERFFFIPARYQDNKYVDPTYVHQLESLPEAKRRAWMDGDWNVFAGQFFSEFRASLHVVNPFIPRGKEVIVGGMDWGRAKPFSFHLATVEKIFWNEKSWYRAKTFCEVYGTDKTPKEWALEIRKQLTFYNIAFKDISWIRGDPAMFTKSLDNSISISDQFKENFVNIRPASNDRIGGWEVLHKWLSIAPDGIPYWQITSNCINLVRTLPELVHDDIKLEDVDTEGEDHAPDDARYMFKHLKWLDGGLGAARQGQHSQQPGRRLAALMDDTGKQRSINTDKFNVVNKRRR